MGKKLKKTPEQQIKFHQEQMRGCEQTFVFHALSAGDILNDQKEKLDPGAFMEWTKANWHRSHRTATDYMALAAHGNKQELLSCSNLKEAKEKVKLATIANRQQESSGKSPLLGGIAGKSTKGRQKEDERKNQEDPDGSGNDDSGGEPEITEQEQEAIQTVKQSEPCDQQEDYEGVSEHGGKPAALEVMVQIESWLADDVITDSDLLLVMVSGAGFNILAKTAEWIKKGHITPNDLRRLADQFDHGFQPPTQGEARSKAKEIQEQQAKDGKQWPVTGEHPFDLVERFLDHFNSNGWKVSGKTPMKDWVGSLRNFGKNNFGGQGKNGPTTFQQQKQANTLAAAQRFVERGNEQDRICS